MFFQMKYQIVMKANWVYVVIIITSYFFFEYQPETENFSKLT